MKSIVLSENPRIEFILGDCMDYMETLQDKAFELAIVDPPYGLEINKSGRCGHYGGKGKSWDNNTPDIMYFNKLFNVSQNQIIWGGNYFKLDPCKCFLIWDKQQPEDVSFASCEFAWTNMNSVAKTFYMRPICADGKNGRIHPTQKPVALYNWILSKYAKKGDRILDTHGGSFSSAIACYYAGHDFVGIELDEDYFEQAVNRFVKETKQKTLVDFLD